jgi:hypothetical protein
LNALNLRPLNVPQAESLFLVQHGSDDERGPNSAPYVVLSYAYWHNHFQDDRTVVGGVVRLNMHPFTILGVAPPGVQGTVLFFASDIFVPIVNHEQLSGDKMILNTRGIRWMFEMVGRLKPGSLRRRPLPI